MNFDNPVYKKTVTDDQFMIQREQNREPVCIKIFTGRGFGSEWLRYWPVNPKCLCVRSWLTTCENKFIPCHRLL